MNVENDLGSVVNCPHCGSPVGESRFQGAGYTSAQSHILSGEPAEAAAAYGIKVGIHTTYHHFTTKYDGVTAWDLMFSDASPLLQQQIDTSNTFHTGTDVVALLRKYRGRHHSVHLKENTPSKTATIGEPPTDGGLLVPWDDVLGYLATEKVAWYVIEAEKIPDSLSPLIDSLRFVDARRAAIA